MTDFWERCIKADCVIVPVRLYSGWGADGNYDESKCIGIRFAALYGPSFDATGPDYWFMLDEQVAGLENYYQTPTEALEAVERERATDHPAEGSP